LFATHAWDVWRPDDNQTGQHVCAKSHKYTDFKNISDLSDKMLKKQMKKCLQNMHSYVYLKLHFVAQTCLLKKNFVTKVYFL
jgi:hypothetical protein